MKERILIVEDEGIVTELLQEFLKNLGYVISGVTGYGEEAVELAMETSPDLILMDIKLRGALSGVEAAKEISQRLDVPVVYLTAYSDEETMQLARTTAPFGYIQKPFKGAEVRSAIEIALYRSRMEKMLKEKEQSYRVLAENLPGIVYRVHVHGGRRIQFFNQMVGQMTGYDADEIVLGAVSPLDSLILAEDRQAADARIAEAVAARAPFSIEYRIRRKDGGIRYFLERGRPIYGNDGSCCQIDGVIFDITERKEAEMALEYAYAHLSERNAFIESVVTNIQSGIIVTNTDLEITLVNPYVVELCGRGREEIVGRNLRELCLNLCRRIEDGVNCDEIDIHPFGKELTIGFTRFDLKGNSGVVTGHIIAFKDLTEVVKIRQEMRKKERLATMGEVVARVAHEMRNPLFAITAVAQILGMELELSPSQKELMTALLTEGRRLNHLVEELLDCSKELKLKKKALDIQRIIDESIRINGAYKSDKGIQIRKNFLGENSTLAADPERIEQVFINLLQNAVDATPPGGSVDLWAQEKDDSMEVRITDSGRGIPAGSLEKIFEVFYTTKRHGTGLGLHISKKIVEAHGGTLTVENNPGGGATFTVLLPLGMGDL